MSRRDIRYTIRFSEKEWEILEEKIKKEDAWKFKYGIKEGKRKCIMHLSGKNYFEKK